MVRSKRYCQQFGRLQTAVGMPAKARPTAYGFRHTFIDELKQKGIEESLVAQIVGHTHQSMTFGRYGKKYPIQMLASTIAYFGAFRSVISGLSDHPFRFKPITDSAIIRSLLA